MINNFRIRQGNENDVAAIAQLHALSWQHAYHAFLPGDFLNNLEIERRTYWSHKFKGLGNNDFILVIEENNLLIGFCCVLFEKDDYDAFIDNLHVHPGNKRKGYGRSLLSAVAKDLLHLGKNNLFLWVLDFNYTAIQFYEKMGGVPADKSIAEIGGVQLPETRYVWYHLDKLITNCS